VRLCCEGLKNRRPKSPLLADMSEHGSDSAHSRPASRGSMYSEFSRPMSGVSQAEADTLSRPSSRGIGGMGRIGSGENGNKSPYSPAPGRRPASRGSSTFSRPMSGIAFPADGETASPLPSRPSSRGDGGIGRLGIQNVEGTGGFDSRPPSRGVRKSCCFLIPIPMIMMKGVMVICMDCVYVCISVCAWAWAGYASGKSTLIRHPQALVRSYPKCGRLRWL
jgi:hypothetical protein